MVVRPGILAVGGIRGKPLQAAEDRQRRRPVSLASRDVRQRQQRRLCGRKQRRGALERLARDVRPAESRLFGSEEQRTEVLQRRLVEATPEAYREKGRFTPPGQPDRGKSQAWAYPVVANGRLYLRDFGVVWCYDVRASQAAR